MNHLHQTLLKSSSVYRKWHLDRDYHLRHWAIFIAAAVVSLVLLTGAINNYVAVELSQSRAATIVAEFYVDPTYTGGSNDGSAAHPWTAMGSRYDDPRWAPVNTALANGPVTIYFSARQASADVSEELVGNVFVGRTDTSTNRLTIGGMSKYNTSDTNPSWANYSGANKFRIKVAPPTTGCCMAIGWETAQGKKNYITLRGFEVTGSGARILFGGSHVVLENMYSHDITDLGATIQFHSATNAKCEDLGRSTDIIIRNNLVERGYGEGIYMASNYQTATQGGCPSYGNGHSDIRIEQNTIRYSGYNGGQGDGIDLKAGLLNVTVRNNTIENCVNDCQGIAVSGVFPGAKGTYVIEGNRISANIRNGVLLGAQNGTVLRNNLIYNNANGGISLTGTTGDAIFNSDVQIYNNTVYNNAGGGIGFGDSDGIISENNLVFNNGAGYQTNAWGSTNITSDYNLYSAPGPAKGYTEGTHSTILSNTIGLTVNPANGDFHLLSSSPAIDKGVDLTATGFATDFDKVTRPQGAGWDIGAYEYASGTILPPTYTLTVLKSGTGSGTVTGTGINCGTDCTETLVSGTTLTLTASPDSGSTFSSWSGGGCSGSVATCTLTLNADTTVTATFDTLTDITPPTVSITSSVNGGTITRATKLDIQAQATDDTAVSEVKFFINGTLKCTDTSPTQTSIGSLGGQASLFYTCSWNVPGRVGRTYRLQTMATDSSGNFASSGVITVIAK